MNFCSKFFRLSLSPWYKDLEVPGYETGSYDCQKGAKQQDWIFIYQERYSYGKMSNMCIKRLAYIPRFTFLYQLLFETYRWCHMYIKMRDIYIYIKISCLYTDIKFWQKYTIWFVICIVYLCNIVLNFAILTFAQSIFSEN